MKVRIKRWNFELNNSPRIDFCLWILQSDGLQVYPFDSHSGGNQELQKIGLNARDWLQWFIKVIRTQDPRLLGCSSVEEKQKRFEQIQVDDQIFYQESKGLSLSFRNRHLDKDSRRTELETKLNKSLENYRMAAQHAEPFCRYCYPPQIWKGNPEVGLLLQRLWKEYQASYRAIDSSKRANKLGLQTTLEYIIGEIVCHSARRRFLKQIQSHVHETPYLKIIQIYYPDPLTLLLPPYSIVTSRYIDFKKGEDYELALQVFKNFNKSSEEIKLLHSNGEIESLKNYSKVD